MPACLERAGGWFYLGVLCMEIARQKRQTRQIIRTSKACLRQMQYCSLGGPQNFAGKVFLLEAEMASYHGKNDSAFESTFVPQAWLEISTFPISPVLPMNAWLGTFTAWARWPLLDRTGKKLANAIEHGKRMHWLNVCMTCWRIMQLQAHLMVAAQRQRPP